MFQKIIKSRVNLLGKQKGVVFGKQSLKMVEKSSTRTIRYSDILGFCTIKRSFFGYHIQITTDNGEVVIGGLSHNNTIPQVHAINQAIQVTIKSKIADIYTRFSKAAVGQYLRESTIPEVQAIIEPMVRLYNKTPEIWETHLSGEPLQKIKKLSELSPISTSANYLRDLHVGRVLSVRKNFYDSIESNPLTEEQRLSVVQHDDFNMVLAAAGTGKTSVMVAKTTDILERQLAKPEEVMVLAFGNAAAEELRIRSQERLKAANIHHYDLDKQISTFHSRGFQIIAAAQKQSVEEFRKLNMSWLVKKPALLEFINNWLVTFIEESEENLNTFIETVYYAYNPFLSESDEAHQETLKGKKYITLNGVEVKGYQEVLIGNWLFKNGIEYVYEPNYSNRLGTDIGFPYRPDFYVKPIDEAKSDQIYIEHFGIDREGNTRADINRTKYNQGIEDKKALHKRMGTKLVDTYHYDWCEGNLETVLEAKLRALNVVPKPISKDEILEAVRKQDFIKNAINELSETLSAVRSESIEGYEIQRRLEVADIQNARSHMALIEGLRQAYVRELRSRNHLDFDDMILLATQYVKEGMFKPEWKYILVDEFQDISVSRWNFLMELLKASGSSLTVVGDDWQAIYAFIGGKLEYTTRFQNNVGNHALTKLQKTFRYNNSIADTAGGFVMKNPEQYQKHIVTHTQVESSEVFLIDNHDANEKDPTEATLNAVEKAIKEIYADDPDASIGILTRYRKSKTAAAKRFTKKRGFKNMKFWTLHGSKGLEADYCFVLDLNQGYFGFPTERKENEIVSALMPTVDMYPHAEERRLLYVAITRSKKRCYLVADPEEPSEFVLELLSSEYDINIVSEHFTPEKLAARKCPNCKTGYLKPKKGERGTYVCSTGLGCLTEAVDCKSCTDGLAVKKSKHGECLSCKVKFQLCPRCNSPKITRPSQYGLFVACCGYKGEENDDSCKYKDKLPMRLKGNINANDRIPYSGIL
ncbi:UvrD-helicase domain-containing protein [Vibrio parahaemolyticus]|uniref:UvrD-helicase domain-containing protein n=1 Tax=Vibrio parahaemolyticus TaxID=670 RepID=UPI0010AA210D|nr:UvrD-helicase domain-containing protein [Vibrio parahaemolyticus]THE58417.1 helicase IV [Vibrio parahaemolyticus]